MRKEEAVKAEKTEKTTEEEEGGGGGECREDGEDH